MRQRNRCMMELRAVLQKGFSLIFMVVLLVFFGGCGGGGEDSGGAGEPVNLAPQVGVGEGGGGSGQVGGELKYFMKEDFARHRFRVSYVSEQKDSLSQGGSEGELIKDERFEVVMRMSSMEAEEANQVKLEVEAEQVALTYFGVKIDSASLVPPLEVESYPAFGDVHRALVMLSGMRFEVWVKVDRIYEVVKVIEEDTSEAVGAESEVFRYYFEKYKELFTMNVLRGAVSAAGDYLPGKEVSVGQKWDIGVMGSGLTDSFPIQTQCRLDEVLWEGDQELAWVTYAIGHLSEPETEIQIEGQAATVKKMLMDGNGDLKYNLREDFARDFSMKYKNTIDLLFEDASEGVLTIEEEKTFRKEIIDGG